MLISSLLLLDAIFEARKAFRELSILLRLANLQIRRKERKKFVVTVTLAITAIGPLYSFAELIVRISA
jgi:hypothetical protein